MNITEIDIQILKIFNQPISPVVNEIVVVAIFAVYLFLISLVYYFFRTKQNSKFIHLFTVSIIGYLMVTAIKYLVAQPRPYVTLPSVINSIITKPYDPFSFPSGHAFIAFLILMFLPKEFPKWSKALSIIYIIFIPIASMYIGVHYPTDVLAGALLGILVPKIISEKISMRLMSFALQARKSVKI